MQLIPRSSSAIFRPAILTIFILLVLTGMTGLIYQVAWQKYLSYLIGSESRSSALVIAVFLCGLASGNAFFGPYSQRHSDRKRLLNTYALCEALIGAYAIVFPKIFDIVTPLVWGFTPSNPFLTFFLHLILTVLLVFPPTFLMGSTITLLTKALPETIEATSDFHAKVYGINTAGAFIGVILSSLVIFPLFGLSLSLTLFGIVNLLCALVLASLPLTGETLEVVDNSSPQKEQLETQHSLSNRELLGITFFSGLIIIALEVLVIRLFSLSAGPTHLSYPLVVGLFILTLARASLGLKEVSLWALRKTLWPATLFTLLFFYCAPFWPYWISDIRASLTNIESNYYIYYCAIFLLLLIVISPAIYFLGRLLPLSYALMKKDSGNYASLVGKLYVLNTLGTLVGALIPGHYLLFWLDIPEVFAIFGALIILYTLRVELLQRNTKSFITAGLGLCLLTPLLFLSLDWNRDAHVSSPYNITEISSLNFKGLFRKADLLSDSKTLMLADGPNTTVAVREMTKDRSRSIIVNGKSDGTTGEPDLSTVTLLSVLPYLHGALNAKSVDASVIGLGTGISPGILASFSNIERVETLEIAPTVVEAGKYFDEFNHNLSKNPKSKIINQDAFSFYGPRQKTFDLIVSEPSNPWLSGVENLFTQTFYRLISKSLKDDGVFTQWIHTYYMNPTILASIFENIRSQFKDILIYRTSRGDIAMVCSNSQTPLLKRLESNLKAAPRNEFLMKTLQSIGIEDVRTLPLLLQLGAKEIKLFTLSHETFVHDLHTPNLQHFSSMAFFKRSLVTDLIDVMDDDIIRSISTIKEQKQHAFKVALETKTKCHPNQKHVYCEALLNVIPTFRLYQNQQAPPQNRLSAYAKLRRDALIEADQEFLSTLARDLPLGPSYRIIMRDIVVEWVKDGDYQKARELTRWTVENHGDQLDPNWHQQALAFIDKKQKEHQGVSQILMQEI